MTIEILAVSISSVLGHLAPIALRCCAFTPMISHRQKRMLLVLHALLMLSNVALYLVVGLTSEITLSFYKLDLLVFYLLASAVNIVVIPGHFQEHMFVLGIVGSVNTTLIQVGFYLVQLNNATEDEMLLITNGIAFVLIGLTYFPLRRMLIHAITPFLSLDSGDYWNTIWVIPIALFMVSYLTRPLNEHITSLLELTAGFITLGATLLVSVSVSRDYRRLLEREALGHQVELQKNYYEALTSAVNAERRARHDFKHQFAVLERFVKIGDSVALNEYFAQLKERMPSKNDIPYTGNAAADGVLYHYLVLAQNAGIKMSVCCSFEQTAINELDLCSLLGNALSNALEGCQTISGDRWIRIGSAIEDGILFITVDNPFDGKLEYKGKRLLSRKRENAPGIGIMSMQEICKKYNGICGFQGGNSIFSVNIALKLC